MNIPDGEDKYEKAYIRRCKTFQVNAKKREKKRKKGKKEKRKKESYLKSIHP